MPQIIRVGTVRPRKDSRPIRMVPRIPVTLTTARNSATFAASAAGPTCPSTRQTAVGRLPGASVLDAPRGGGADVLVDRECLPQVRGGMAGVAVLQVGLAEPFQGACFLWGRAEVAGDGQRLGVTRTGLAGGRGTGRELAKAVERLGLAELVAEVTE
jgi:hypothetical protein